MSIVVKDLLKEYGEQRAVDNISFTARKGQILGFLGPNGAGKSTTMKIATCYLTPTAGEVEVCGYSVAKDPIAVRKHVGYLPEHNPLYLDMFVHEYLRFIASLHGLKGSGARTRIAEMVELVGLTKEQNKPIGALSKGYRQRVGLAQALIHNPDVLILDEPTTGLDPNQIVEIRQVIKQISHEKTVVFSTHIMQEVQALCDRVIIIKSGKLVADQGIAELQSQGGSTQIVVELEGLATPEAFKLINGVSALEKIGERKWAIHTATGNDLRAEVFRTAAEKGIIIIGMYQQETSLEKVFQQLTQ